MIDNVATRSYKSYVNVIGPTSNPQPNSINSSTTDNVQTNVVNTCATPARPSQMDLVVPNAPRISRRRTIPAPQLSAARRNIFYFIVNEE